jgi:glycosyltransferase involved in cell wall biosynthesis
MPRKVCIVSSGNLASNPRLLKEADALHEAGYGVTAVVCDYTAALRDFDDDIAAKVPWTVVRVPRPSWERYLHVAAKLGARVLAGAGLGVPLSLAANAYGGPAQALHHALRDLSADLYIAHYVPALPAAAFAARRHGGLLGFDAEDFHSGEGTGGAAEDFRMAMVRSIERACLAHCAHMTTASPLIGQAYKSLYGVSSTTVLNVFPLEMLTASAKPCARHADQGTLRAYWFSQTVGLDRGLQAFLRAMAAAKARVSLDIRGSNRWGHGDTLMALARELGIAERVRLLPTAAPDEMVDLAAAYDLGLSLETEATESRRLCLTNKIFTYLLAGVPVMMSDTPAQRALAPELGDAGAVASLADPPAMARVLDRLAGSPDVLDRAKATAAELGRQRYNWQVEKRALLSSVERAFAQQGPA